MVFSPLQGELIFRAPGARAYSAAPQALLPAKRGILFPKRIPLLKTPEKGEGSPPSTPGIGSL
mgnify:CR=1 FL=1